MCSELYTENLDDYGKSKNTNKISVLGYLMTQKEGERSKPHCGKEGVYIMDLWVKYWV